MQTQTFSFSPPINLSEEGKWLLAVTSFETTKSVFIVTDENNSVLISKPIHWNSEAGEEFINKLNKLLQLRSENDIDLHVNEIGKRPTQIEIENNVYNLAGFIHFENEILAELKREIYKDFDDMLYRMELTYDEIVDNFDVKHFAGSTTGYTFPTGI